MTTMNPITPVEQHTVLVVDDHPLFRRGVCELFSLDPTIRVVGEAGTREEALDLAEKLSPDLIVLDLNMGFVWCGNSYDLKRARSLSARGNFDGQ